MKSLHSDDRYINDDLCQNEIVKYLASIKFWNS